MEILPKLDENRGRFFGRSASPAVAIGILLSSLNVEATAQSPPPGKPAARPPSTSGSRFLARASHILIHRSLSLE
jgi:hypothetical protein